MANLSFFAQGTSILVLNLAKAIHSEVWTNVTPTGRNDTLHDDRVTHVYVSHNPEDSVLVTIPQCEDYFLLKKKEKEGKKHIKHNKTSGDKHKWNKNYSYYISAYSRIQNRDPLST